MPHSVTLHLAPRASLYDGFYCSHKAAMVIDERYYRHICDRRGVHREHRKTKYAQQH